MIDETLNFKQVLCREYWRNRTKENIQERSKAGAFRLYFRPPKIIGFGSEYIDVSINECINAIKNFRPEDKAGKEIEDRYNNFLKNNKHLLKHRPGYVGLPTDEESQILLACTRSSVSYLISEGAVHGKEWNNLFGWELRKLDPHKEEACVARLHSLGTKLISEDDLFVFVDDIEAYEKSTSSIDYSEIKNCFIKIGDCYEISYNGQKIPPIKMTKGLQYIEILLKNPYKEFSVNMLFNVCNSTISGQSLVHTFLN